MTDIPEDVRRVANAIAANAGWSVHEDARRIAEAILADRDARAKAEPVAWTNRRQLAILQSAPKESAAVWGLRNGSINVPLYPNPPDAAATIARLEAEKAELLEGMKALVGHHNDYNASSGNMEQAYYKLAKYAYADWKTARSLIAKHGGNND